MNNTSNFVLTQILAAIQAQGTGGGGGGGTVGGATAANQVTMISQLNSVVANSSTAANQATEISYLSTIASSYDTTNGVQKIVTANPLVSTYSALVDVAFGTAVTHTSKASAALLKALNVSSINTAVRYFQFFNSASSTAGTPVFSFPIPAANANNPSILILDTTFFGLNGSYFSTGLTWGISTTQATYTGATSTDHNVNILYY
jgi:hypothetical protein